MKKLNYLILIVPLISALVLIGCGNSNDKGDVTTVQAENDTSVATTEDAATATETVTTAEEATTEEATEETTEVLFNGMIPENDTEVVLVHKYLYDWYSAYKTEADYYSSVKVTKTVPSNYPVAVKLSWNFANTADKYTLTYATKSDLSDGVSIETTEKEVSVDTLFVGTEYYWQVSAKIGEVEEKSKIMTFKTADTMRLLAVQKLENARDIGGLTSSFGMKIQQGRAYRTGNVENLSADAIKDFKEKYGVKTEIDLRYTTEINGRTESVLGSDVNYVSLPSSQYFQLFTAAYPGSFKNALLTFADEANYPIDFHCSVGRDRTGTLAAFIYVLCGVDEVSIVRDYEASFLKNKTNVSMPSGTCEEKMSIYFIPFLEQMKRTFKTDDLTIAAERMAQYYGLTAAQINAIRRNLLGDEYKDREIPEWTHTIERIDEQSEPVLSWKGSEVADNFINKSLRETIKSATASEDGTYSTVTADTATEGIVYYGRGIVPMQTASVIAIKYRTSSMTDGKAYFEVFVDSSQQEPGGGMNVRENFICDGEWHIMVIDLEKKISGYNGYSATMLRVDLFNGTEEGQSIDYSFVGFFTSTETANNYFAN